MTESEEAAISALQQRYTRPCYLDSSITEFIVLDSRRTEMEALLSTGDSPTVTSVQVLLLLGIKTLRMSQRRKAWNFFGLASYAVVVAGVSLMSVRRLAARCSIWAFTATDRCTRTMRSIAAFTGCVTCGTS